jgi:hypothetical protein
MHQLYQTLKYRLSAKNRHGVHSPFVYDFIEQIINGKYKNPSITTLNNILNQHALMQLHSTACIAAYYNISTFKKLDAQQNFIVESINANQLGTMYLLHAAQKWYMQTTFEENDIVLIEQIHKTEQCEAYWQNMIQQTNASLSIDLFDIGILFFRKDFLVKQHFVLQNRF